MMRAQHFEEMPLNPRIHTEGKGKIGRKKIRNDKK
jgi:hypothetical protein